MQQSHGHHLNTREGRFGWRLKRQEAQVRRTAFPMVPSIDKRDTDLRKAGSSGEVYRSAYRHKNRKQSFTKALSTVLVWYQLDRFLFQLLQGKLLLCLTHNVKKLRSFSTFE